MPPETGFLQCLTEGFARRKTPFLLMRRQLLQEKCAAFTRYAPRVMTHYSVKANPAPQLLREMEKLGLWFEVSSQDELRTVLSLGVPKEKISTSNPVKSIGFVRYAAKQGVRRYVVDSQEEVEKLARLAADSEVLVRLVTDNSESAWPLDEKYGVESDEALDLLLEARRLGLRPLGVTFHVGSQCTGLSSWRSALEKAAKVWRRALNKGIHLRVLNLGGGFPAAHVEQVPPVHEIMDRVLGCMEELFPDDVSLVAEPGRALVGDVGVLVTSVIGKARREGRDWMYLDVGVFNGLMEAVGGITYRFMPTGTNSKNGVKSWVLAGPSCDSFDVIARDVPLPDLQVGERVMIYPGGAYTTAYASRFNGMPVPKTYLL